MQLLCKRLTNSDQHTCHVGRYMPVKSHENRSEFKQSFSMVGSGEIDRTVEKLRPNTCLIRSVRDRANQWAFSLPHITKLSRLRDDDG